MSNICPECGREINHLVNWESGENRYEFDGEEYETDEFVGDGQINDYECPYCNETLATDEDKARKILGKGEDWVWGK